MLLVAVARVGLLLQLLCYSLHRTCRQTARKTGSFPQVHKQQTIAALNAKHSCQRIILPGHMLTINTDTRSNADVLMCTCIGARSHCKQPPKQVKPLLHAPPALAKSTTPWMDGWSALQPTGRQNGTHGPCDNRHPSWVTQLNQWS